MRFADLTGADNIVPDVFWGGVRGRMRGGERRGGEEEREFGRETGGYGRSCIEGKAKSKKKDEKS